MDVALEKSFSYGGCRRCKTRRTATPRESLRQKDRVTENGGSRAASARLSAVLLFSGPNRAEYAQVWLFLFAAKQKKGECNKCQWINWLLW
jgi:hypothetical protein